MIIETVVTTENSDGSTNVAPMGMVINSRNFEFAELRPFQKTTTLDNLLRTHAGVIHITDDSRLIMKAALGLSLPAIEFKDAESVTGKIIADCCQAFEFKVQHCDTSTERTTVIVKILARHTLRDFLGFNRAAMAIIEATILATRLQFIPAETIDSKLIELRPIVEKTGSELEHQSFDELCAYIESASGNLISGSESGQR